MSSLSLRACFRLQPDAVRRLLLDLARGPAAPGPVAEASDDAEAAGGGGTASGEEVAQTSEAAAAGSAAGAAEVFGITNKLSLIDCVQVDDSVLEAAAHCAAGPRLRELELTGCFRVAGPGLAAVASRCAGLRAVTMRKCVKVSNAAIEGLLRGVCRRLEALDVRSCARVGDGAARAVASFAPPTLTRVNLGGCPGLTDVGVEQLLSSPVGARLHSLGLSASHGALTEACLMGLGAAEQLRRLELAGNRDAVTDRVLEAIGQGCGRLEVIDLRGCSQVTDAGVAALVEGCGASLTSLRLEMLYRVTDESIDRISTQCPRLQLIDLRLCNLVGDDGLVRLAERRKGSLREMRLGSVGSLERMMALSKRIKAICPQMTVRW